MGEDGGEQLHVGQGELTEDEVGFVVKNERADSIYGKRSVFFFMFILLELLRAPCQTHMM
jgi:hypothetical protein